MASKEEIFEKVRDIVATELEVDKEQVVMGARYIEDLGADSLDTVELVMALEDEFGTNIPDDEAEKLTSIESTVQYIVDSQ
jgi:acyl carrier protein